MVTLSTCEVEYIAGALSMFQAVWVINLLQDLKIKVIKPVRLITDNKPAISLAKNLMLHGMRSTLTRNSIFLHNQVQSGVLEVVHYSTQKQLVDILTKAIKT